MTKLDKIFNAWDAYVDAKTHDPEYTLGEQARFVSVAVSDLNKLGVKWPRFGGSATINGCIILACPL